MFKGKIEQILAILVCSVVFIAANDKQQAIVSRIAFGSCNRHDLPQPVWEGVVSYKPDVWIWTGDVVYADTMIVPFYWVPSSESVVRAKYEAQKSRSEYKKLLNVCDNILGVWDDHDFGQNNGGKEHGGKSITQEIFLDFLDVPKDSPRRKQEGLYSSATFGPSDKRVKVILLDARYFRDPPTYLGIEKNDMLGAAQWEWLEKELHESDARVNMIVSGIQVLPHDKPVEEKWANYPSSRQRLFKLIASSKAKGVIFLSGDVHYAEILGTNNTDNGYPIFEVTSSGMTHSCETQVPFKKCRNALDMFMRSKYQVTDFYEFFNFGTIDINWDRDPVTVDMNIRNENGTIAINYRVNLQDLEYDADFASKHSYSQEENPPMWTKWTIEMLRNLYLFIFAVILLTMVILYMVYRSRSTKGTKIKTKDK